MEKGLCWGAAVVGGLLLVLFLLDMVLSLMGQEMQPYAPFGGIDMFVDVVCAIASGLLLYISIDALREIK